MASVYQVNGETDCFKISKMLRDDFTYFEDQKLYKDKTFPAECSSIGTEEFCKGLGTVTWLRPKDILKGTNTKPEFFVQGPSKCDIEQGQIGDCWVLAAAASLAMDENLLYQVVPKNQSFRKDCYDGTFHFRFWQFGEWKDVVVDDLLPTRKDEEGKPYLIALHSSVNNEFWPALLEKAYAKLYGSYQAVDGGYFSEAMEDFTGGVSEMYAADSNRPVDLFGVLLKAWGKNSLIGCSFKTETYLDDEINDKDNEVGGDCSQKARRESGLKINHAYSITYVGYVYRRDKNREGIPMLRIRNPWGVAEWKGAWSDQSEKWKSILKEMYDNESSKWNLCVDSVSDEEQKRPTLEIKDDGEFWMSFEDFVRYYEEVEICHFNPNNFSDSADKKEWKITEFQGEWVRGATAGGCICDPESFSCNPQYRMTLEKKSTVFVVLLQKHRRTKDLKGSDYLKIGLSIYDHEGEPGMPLYSRFFKNAKKIEIDSYMGKKSAFRSLQYAGRRNVVCRLQLNPGVYAIIPDAVKDYEELEFLLRVFTENKSTVEEYKQVLWSPADGHLVQKFYEKKFNKEGLSVIVTAAFDEKACSIGDEIWKKLFDLTMYNDESYHGVGFTFRNCKSIVAMLLRKRSEINDEKITAYVERTMILARAFNEWAGRRDGFIEALHLRYALSEADYFLDNRTFCDLVRRYRAPEDKGRCYINFDDFFACASEVEKKYIDESSELE